MKSPELELLDLDVAIGDGRIGVVLKEDAPRLGEAPLAILVEVRALVVILRRGKARHVFLSAALVFKDLDAVEPVFDMRPLRDDHRRIPFADWIQVLIRIRRQDIVKCRDTAVAIDALGPVRMALIENLVFNRRSIVECFIKEELDTRVARRGQTEVDLQDKVREFARRDDIAAGLFPNFLCGRTRPRLRFRALHRIDREDAVIDDPARLRESLATILDANPAVRRLAVPKEFPAVRLFGIAQGIRRNRGATCKCRERGNSCECREFHFDIFLL